MSLKFGNKVKIISGFYEGCRGFLTDYGDGEYEVKILHIIHPRKSFYKWFPETSLEKIKD
jgi:hypothetical protein